MVGMIDDFLWIVEREKAAELVEFVKWLMPAMGFALNDKCVWEPATRATFLGLEIDSERMLFVVPTEKLTEARAMVRALRTKANKKGFTSVLSMQKLTGKLMSFLH